MLLIESIYTKLLTHPNQTVTPTDAATHTGQLERDADEYFPLQPIEKKLCAYSLGLGLGLMALFIVIFEVFG